MNPATGKVSLVFNTFIQANPKLFRINCANGKISPEFKVDKCNSNTPMLKSVQPISEKTFKPKSGMLSWDLNFETFFQHSDLTCGHTMKYSLISTTPDPVGKITLKNTGSLNADNAINVNTEIPGLALGDYNIIIEATNVETSKSLQKTFKVIYIN